MEALVKGDLSIIDVKVSNGVYLGMRLQMAAYLQARVEESGHAYPGGRYIIRVDKRTGEPEVVHLPDGFDNDLKAFLGPWPCIVGCWRTATAAASTRRPGSKPVAQEVWRLPRHLERSGETISNWRRSFKRHCHSFLFS